MFSCEEWPRNSLFWTTLFTVNRKFNQLLLSRLSHPVHLISIATINHLQIKTYSNIRANIYS